MDNCIKTMIVSAVAALALTAGAASAQGFDRFAASVGQSQGEAAGMAAALAFPGPFEPTEVRDLAPIQAHAIEMGTIQGAAYYTAEPEGMRVVATVSTGASALRVISTLAADQSMVFAVPGAEGETGITIEFRRQGDRILVSQTPPLSN